MAQLSPPDMRLPIQYALTWPERWEGISPRIDWSSRMSLEFSPPDLDAFPALGLGYEVARRGGTCGAVLNAANEVAVERFLAAQLRFTDIPRLCRSVLEAHDFDSSPSLSELLEMDQWTRAEARSWRAESVNMLATLDSGFLLLAAFNLSLPSSARRAAFWLVLVGIGLVIFFHELGHFAVAKWCDVFVERFSIGFGPIFVEPQVRRDRIRPLRDPIRRLRQDARPGRHGSQPAHQRRNRQGSAVVFGQERRPANGDHFRRRHA